MYRLFHERRYLIPFRATLLPQIFTDVLVIGGGVAGMSAAIRASEHSDVILANKGELPDGSTYWAQGGLAAAIAPDDSPDLHAQDTLDAGAGLCDEAIVRTTVDHAPARLRSLLEAGMAADRHAKAIARDAEGLTDPEVGLATDQLALGREGGHSRHRIIHADGDATGKELAITLDRQVRQSDRVRVFNQCFVLDLITLDGVPPRCVGAITHHPKFGLQVIWAKATILATGGCGQVFRESTNPSMSTGDGIAAAYRAGAEVADMAFVQFHPTTLYVAGASRRLITEAVRGEGAVLIDRSGHRFMPDYHELADLAPRDVVSRAILTQLSKSNFTHVYLDCRKIGGERFAERFPGIDRLLREFDLDPAVDPIPVHPSAHYMIGGVATDAKGRTNLRGLYACGEASCTGLHGANRLASNSLLEGLVFGSAAGDACREVTEDPAAEGPPPKVISDIPLSQRSQLDIADVRSSLRSVMWRHVGIERSGDRLSEVAEMCDFWARYTLDKIFDDRAGWEIQNMLMIAALTTRAAGWREESRGTHFRSDFPDRSDAFRFHDVWVRGEESPTLRATISGDAVLPETQDASSS